MANELLEALSGESVIYRSHAVSVTPNSILLRTPSQRHVWILSRSHVTKITKITTTSPGLLVISAGFLVLSAAAYCSPHDKDTSVALGLLSFAFIVAYLITRKAALTFSFGDERHSTPQAGLSEMAGIVRALQIAPNAANSVPENNYRQELPPMESQTILVDSPQIMQC